MHLALHNTSGSLPERLYKRYISGRKDYVVARGIAVQEGMHRQQVATKLGAEMLMSIVERGQDASRSMTAYVYEDRTPHVADWLLAHTFERTSDQLVNLRGSDLVLARFAAPSVQGVYDSLGREGGLGIDRR